MNPKFWQLSAATALVCLASTFAQAQVSPDTTANPGYIVYDIEDTSGAALGTLVAMETAYNTHWSDDTVYWFWDDANDAWDVDFVLIPTSATVLTKPISYNADLEENWSLLAFDGSDKDYTGFSDPTYRISDNGTSTLYGYVTRSANGSTMAWYADSDEPISGPAYFCENSEELLVEKVTSLDTSPESLVKAN